jgi:hypothetical protein
MEAYAAEATEGRKERVRRVRRMQRWTKGQKERVSIGCETIKETLFRKINTL